MKTYSTLLVFVLLSACEQSSPQPEAPVQSAAVQVALAGMSYADKPDASKEERANAIRTALHTVVEITARADDWREAVEVADRAIRQAAPGVERSRVEQTTAKLLLQAYLVPNADQPGAAEAARVYARALIDRQSPEAEVLLVTVRAFQNSWEPAEVRTIAQEAADAAEASVRERGGCVDCEMPDPIRRDLSRRGRASDVTRAARAEAVRQLREIAG